MNLTRCNNGHFFDLDRFAQCPHCASSAGRPSSVVTVAHERNDGVTMPLAPEAITAGQPPSLESAAKNAMSSATAPPPPQAAEGVTVSYYNKAIGTEPVVGWLVCVEGAHRGEDFKLKSGRNFIGRSANMDVAITGDNSVSREKHAIVVYDPQTHKFMTQPGEARELCYLNGQLVLNTMELEQNDIITVGATKLMFFPCCTDAFHWDMQSGIEP
ncbi:MAG: FHA domain-containing protein [Oscillospiraceae bacterium]|nr:FHA domain-containing protein [Oscillospiraceae bacterium]